MPDLDATYAVGVDFGTLSGRAVVARLSDGEELGAAEHEYADAVIDARLPGTAIELPPDWALQNPADWIAVLRHAVPAAVAASGVDPADVVALGTDFTSCTVLPTDHDGHPLCELATWRDRPHAWPKLWRHHAAQTQADHINAAARDQDAPWLRRYGGKQSCEWQLPKALQVLDEDPEVYGAMERWIEAADWIVWQLTGAETRNAGTAGYKGTFQNGAYPGPDFLATVHPDFADFAATRLEHPLVALGAPAGRLTDQAASWTGLPAHVVVAVGNIDAHVSAPAAQVTEPGHLLLVMGTSTCHLTSSDVLAEISGMGGVVDGGIVAGSWGYEAGQSGTGDIFAWWVERNVPDRYRAAASERGQSVHAYLTELGDGAPVGSHGLIALDWLSGNRSVLVDHRLSGLVVGLTLSTTPQEVYHALLESTAFGTRRIIDAFVGAGVAVDRITAVGGLLRNHTLMQLYADVLGLPIGVGPADHAAALGAAIHGAVAAGAYRDVRTAALHMGRARHDVYRPDARRHGAYDVLYREYLRLHDYFGRDESDGGNEVMHRLRDLRVTSAGC